jgi:hypothetical protein
VIEDVLGDQPGSRRGASALEQRPRVRDHSLSRPSPCLSKPS